MKKFILIPALALALTGCDTLNDLAGAVTTPSTNGSTPALTNTEVVNGLKEALTVGITNSVDLTSVVNGFLNNDKIRLPFPQDAIKVKEKALEWGLDGQVAKFEETLNRAAEEAAKEALPIFKNAITSMTIQDGFNILRGGEGAATTYLKSTTNDALKAAFLPKVEAAISKVKLTEIWNPIVTKYNMAAPLMGYNQVNPDLNQYVLDLATDGLFKMVAEEENKIRKDVGARVTDLLQRVFGSLDKK